MQACPTISCRAVPAVAGCVVRDIQIEIFVFLSTNNHFKFSALTRMNTGPIWGRYLD